MFKLFQEPIEKKLDFISVASRESLSFVLNVIDSLVFLKAAVIVAELGLVEGLGLVEALAVEGAHLVSVLVRLGGPAGAVPKLTVRGVATGELSAGHVLDLVHSAFVELLGCLAVAPVGAVMSNEGALVSVAEGGRCVVNRLEIIGSANHGA